ncbi:MAG: MBL fold metallo-hydrolase, partial [Gemmatimonadota bacterium]|nr:MBL fold metallo-hydrolase [Gemmatimonadota bacterium]
MNIEFWGAARTVTGSMHLVEAAGRRILLDCGMYHGRRKEAFERNRSLPFDPDSLDAVVLSHAHIDHSGNLPTLVRAGYEGEIYATSATRDLAAHMLLDSAHIQESDVRRVNRLRRKQGKNPFEPLYTEEDAIRTLERFVTVPYDRPRQLFPGVVLRFIDAGHMLGSASVVLDEDVAGESRRLLFSGDIGRKGLPILRDPRTIGDVDWVIMESTYGSRTHEPADEAQRYLHETVQRCCDGGSKLLIPSFAVGRTQELAYRLNLLWEAGELPPVDVFIDTPLGVKVTEVY